MLCLIWERIGIVKIRERGKDEKSPPVIYMSAESRFRAKGVSEIWFFKRHLLLNPTVCEPIQYTARDIQDCDKRHGC
jgi:hypothetical protein